MVKRIIIVGVMIAALISVLAITGLKGEKNREDLLVVGTGPLYPPYTTLSETGELVGFDVEVARAIAKRLGKELSIRRMEFDSLILQLRSGSIDLIVSGLSITEARQRAISMVPYQGEPQQRLVLAFTGDPSLITGIEDLRGSQVAVEVGTFHHEFLKTIDGIVVNSLEGVPEVMMDVQYGKSAAALVEPHTAEVIAQKLKQVHLASVPLPKERQTLGMGIGIAKERELLTRQVREVVDALRADGELAQLEDQWFKPGGGA